MKPRVRVYGVKRQSVRFPSDPRTTATMMIEYPDGQRSPPITVMLINESFRGCSLVLPSSVVVEEGANVWVTTADLNAVKAEVRWKAVLDADVVRLGLLYVPEGK